MSSFKNIITTNSDDVINNITLDSSRLLYNIDFVMINYTYDRDLGFDYDINIINNIISSRNR